MFIHSCVEWYRYLSGLYGNEDISQTTSTTKARQNVSVVYEKVNTGFIVGNNRFMKQSKIASKKGRRIEVQIPTDNIFSKTCRQVGKRPQDQFKRKSRYRNRTHNRHNGLLGHVKLSSNFGSEFLSGCFLELRFFWLSGARQVKATISRRTMSSTSPKCNWRFRNGELIRLKQLLPTPVKFSTEILNPV